MQTDSITIDTATHAMAIFHTDVHPFEIVEKRPGKRPALKVRSMNATLDPNWKPEIVPGGFTGHCTNNDSQRWTITPNPAAELVTIRLHSDGHWRDRDGRRYALGNEPWKRHDYNF